MGKKKRSVDVIESLNALESLFDKTYESVLKRVNEKEQKQLDPLSFERYVDTLRYVLTGWKGNASFHQLRFSQIHYPRQKM